MKIGLIVAIEMDSIFHHYTTLQKMDCPKGFELYKAKKENVELFVLKTGMGEVAASCGVQYLISTFHVDMIVNFGVVGGLTAEMSERKVCLVERVVHYKYDCSEFMNLVVGQLPDHDSIFLPTTQELVEHALRFVPDLKKVTCCSGDKFIGTTEEKSYLHETFDGDICDMESAGIVLACEMNDVPCLLFKAVSDGLTGGAKSFYDELLEASQKCLAVADQIIETL